MNQWLPYPECDTCPANYGQCIVDGACPNHKEGEYNSTVSKCESCKHNGWLTMSDVACCNVCENDDYYEPYKEEDNGSDCSSAEQK